MPTQEQPTWKHADAFPIIARVIAQMYREHGCFITSQQIAAGLLEDRQARAMIDGAHQQLQHDWSLQRVAANMVAWFSQRITVGQSQWRQAFERTKVKGQWAYKPAETSRQG